MRISTHVAVVVVVVVLAIVAPGGFAQTDAPPTVLYRLQAGSTYEEGCYGQCMCPVIQVPLEGTFGLELLPTAGPLDTFGVDEIHFTAQALDRTLTGSGFYTLAGELNSLELDLQTNGEPAQHFHSGGLVAAGAEFPEIDIVISVHQMVECFDYVLHIVASPSPETYPTLTVDVSDLAWSPVPGAESYDVVCGDLDYLRSSAGDFTYSTDQCLESNYPGTAMSYDLAPGPGETLWLLVRDHLGSYEADEGSQIGSRTAEIDSSPLSCP